MHNLLQWCLSCPKPCWTLSVSTLYTNILVWPEKKGTNFLNQSIILQTLQVSNNNANVKFVLVPFVRWLVNACTSRSYGAWTRNGKVQYNNIIICTNVDLRAYGEQTVSESILILYHTVVRPGSAHLSRSCWPSCFRTSWTIACSGRRTTVPPERLCRRRYPPRWYRVGHRLPPRRRPFRLPAAAAAAVRPSRNNRSTPPDTRAPSSGPWLSCKRVRRAASQQQMARGVGRRSPLVCVCVCVGVQWRVRVRVYLRARVCACVYVCRRTVVKNYIICIILLYEY